MSELKQLVFDEIYHKTGKTWYACPEINGIDNEFEDNKQKLNRVSNACIWDSIKLFERQIYLINRRRLLTRQRE